MHRYTCLGHIQYLTHWLEITAVSNFLTPWLQVVTTANCSHHIHLILPGTPTVTAGPAQGFPNGVALGTVARPHSLCSSHRPKIHLFPKAHHGQILTGTLGRVDWGLAPRLQVYRIQAQLTRSLLHRELFLISLPNTASLPEGNWQNEWRRGGFQKSPFPSHTICRYRPIKCMFSILWIYKPKSSLLVIYSKSLISNQLKIIQ